MGGHSPYGSPRASPLPSRRSPSPRRFDVGFAAAVSNLVEQAHTIADHDRKKPYGEILRAQALGCYLGCYADGGASRTPPGPVPSFFLHLKALGAFLLLLQSRDWASSVFDHARGSVFRGSAALVDPPLLVPEKAEV